MEITEATLINAPDHFSLDHYSNMDNVTVTKVVCIVRPNHLQFGKPVKSKICCKFCSIQLMTMGFQPERATTLLPSLAAAFVKRT